METLTAKFTVNTPMFMSGANQKQAELRTASIKGVIRFWWRALHYAEFETLSALKKREEELFGSTKRQASVRFVIKYSHSQLSFDNPKSKPVWLQRKKGCVYLGFGVIDFKEELEHPCIQHNKIFTLKLVAKNEIDPSIINAVKLFGLIGGAGAKSRKGYGSVSLVDLKKNEEPINCPDDMESYKKELQELLSQAEKFSLPAEYSFTAFSDAARVDALLSGPDPIAILNNYGEAMQLYRSWGRENSGRWELPNRREAEQNFKDDHDWFKDVPSFRSNKPDFHPERALFGLPHNYYSKDASASVEPADFDRRASPLFFHIHKLSNNTYLGISLLLPSKFLPDKEGGNLIGDKKNVQVQENDYQVLTRFLEGKKGHRTSKTQNPYFPEREKIWPKREEQ